MIILTCIWPIILVAPLFYEMTARSSPVVQDDQKIQSSGSPQPTYAPSLEPEHGKQIVMALGVVVAIFGVDVTILWLLAKIGGPLKADVKTTISKFGGNIAIAGAGLVGCFLAVAALAFGGLYLVSYLMN